AALQRRRRPTYFLSQIEPASLGLGIKRAGNTWLEADSPVGRREDLDETVQEIRRLRPAAVIVDSPEAEEEYLAELGSNGPTIVTTRRPSWPGCCSTARKCRVWTWPSDRSIPIWRICRRGPSRAPIVWRLPRSRPKSRLAFPERTSP